MTDSAPMTKEDIAALIERLQDSFTITAVNGRNPYLSELVMDDRPSDVCVEAAAALKAQQDEIERLRNLIAEAAPVSWARAEHLDGAKDWEVKAAAALGITPWPTPLSCQPISWRSRKTTKPTGIIGSGYVRKFTGLFCGPRNADCGTGG